MGSEYSTEEKTLVIIAEGWRIKNSKKKKNDFQESTLSPQNQANLHCKKIDLIFRVLGKDRNPSLINRSWGWQCWLGKVAGVTGVRIRSGVNVYIVWSIMESGKLLCNCLSKMEKWSKTFLSYPCSEGQYLIHQTYFKKFSEL